MLACAECLKRSLCFEIETTTDKCVPVCVFFLSGNLTKHMKSKAHSKKCQEMGVLVSSLVELEAEEGIVWHAILHTEALYYLEQSC